MTDLKESYASVTDIATLHKELDETSCPICMEYPHNAVLLLCSSREKGCKSYICDTSYRHSNCLDRFKKLEANNTKPSYEPNDSAIDSSDARNIGLNISPLVIPSPMTMRNLAETDEGSSNLVRNTDSQEPVAVLQAQDVEMIAQEDSGGDDASESRTLKCPHCRGAVVGWIIMKEARLYLDQKPRSCSRESCSFSGNYKELRRHARRIHPTTRPADVDPSRQRAWQRLEHQREYGDILSAIRSAMPGAVVLGDYVIDSGDAISRDRERNGSAEGAGPWWTTFFLFHMIRSSAESLDEPRASSRAWRTHRRSGHRNLWGENLLGIQEDDDDNMDDDIPIPRRRRRFTRTRPDEQP